MKELWVNYNNRFDKKNKREKYLIVAAVCFVLYFFWAYIVSPSLENKRKILKDRYALIEKKINDTELISQLLSKNMNDDPNKEKSHEVTVLLDKIRLADKEIELLSAGLVLPKDLQKVMYDVLASNKKMNLLGFDANKPQELKLYGEVIVVDGSSLGGNDKVENAGKEQQRSSLEGENKRVRSVGEYRRIGVYKHSVVVRLEGNYFDTIEYLNMLENLVWKFYWSTLRYEVTEYPKARVTFEVYTLSTLSGDANG